MSNRAAYFIALAVLAGTLACGGGEPATAGDDSTPASEDALTVDELRPVDSQPLVVNVPAVRSTTTGAATWSLYSIAAKDVGPKHASFAGLLAYGADAQNQAIWGLVIDRDHPMRAAIQFDAKSGKTLTKLTIAPDTLTALDAEVENLRQKVAMSPGKLPGGAQISAEDAAKMLSKRDAAESSWTTWTLRGVAGVVGTFVAACVYGFVVELL